MKKYIKPEMEPTAMAPVSIMGGSVKVKGKVGISSFFTDEDDWYADENTKRRTYSFWD